MSTPTKHSPFPAQPYIRYQRPVEDFERPLREEPVRDQEAAPEDTVHGLVLIVLISCLLWGLIALGYWVGGWS